MDKIAVVAGNGESLNSIDYSRLPEDFDLFRCNQFYFEQKYFLGRKIKYVFFIPCVFFEQYFTAKNLQIRGEYEIGGYIFSDFGLGRLDIPRSDFDAFYPDVKRGYEYLKRLKSLDAFIKFNENYHQRRITSGVYMCAIAVAMGYNKIYIAGIDLYSNGSTYAFETKQKNLITLLPSFQNKNSKFSFHSADYDLEVIDFLAKNYDIEFYSICPNSPISSKISLAKIGGDKGFVVKPKPLNYIKDIMLPSVDAYNMSSINCEISEMLKSIQRDSKISRRYNFLYLITGGSLGRKWFKKIKNYFKIKREIDNEKNNNRRY